MSNENAPWSVQQIKEAIARTKQADNMFREVEERVLIFESSQFMGMTQKQVSEAMHIGTWSLYNIRRAGVKKLAAANGIDDVEEAFRLLGIKRGKLRPRTTRYYQPPDEDEPQGA